jgi:hypothetical protein
MYMILGHTRHPKSVVFVRGARTADLPQRDGLRAAPFILYVRGVLHRANCTAGGEHHHHNITQNITKVSYIHPSHSESSRQLPSSATTTGRQQRSRQQGGQTKTKMSDQSEMAANKPTQPQPCKMGCGFFVSELSSRNKSYFDVQCSIVRFFLVSGNRHRPCYQLSYRAQHKYD